MSLEEAEKYFSSGNEAFVDEDYDLAIKCYTDAIQIDKENGGYYLKRCNALIKKDDFEGAISDADECIKYCPNDVRVYQRKGFALFSLETFEEALLQYRKASEIGGKNEQVELWIRKCEAEVNLKDQCKESKPGIGLSSLHLPEQAKKEPPKEECSVKKEQSSANKEEIPMPSPAKAKYDWYQTESQVIISVLIKKIKQEDVSCDFTDKNLSATIKLPTGSDYSLELDLAHSVVPKECSFKVFSTKVDIKLKKEEGIRWSKLEGEYVAKPVVKHIPDDSADVDKYPSSTHMYKRWEQLAKEVEAAENEEIDKGEGGLDSLFKKIYADGSVETRRAMNKSFQESGGTVLSTNWSEISKERVEIKPPDCMEYKKYEM